MQMRRAVLLHHEAVLLFRRELPFGFGRTREVALAVVLFERHVLVDANILRGSGQSP